MRQVRFSVITIALNDLAGLRATTDSVMAQNFLDFEWIIVDGGSTDGTLEFLKQLAHPSGRWVSEPDKGLFDAMNKGLDRAAGQYVIFMNSGDRFADGQVLRLVDEAISETGLEPDLIFGDAYEETARGSLLLKPARPASAIKRGMFTHHQAMFYARKTIGNTRYDCCFRVAADYHFTCRLLACNARTVRVGFSICIFKQAGNSRRYAGTGRRENLAVQKEVLRLGTLRRTYNHASFLASAFLRTYMRGFYHRIRFRQVTPRP